MVEQVLAQSGLNHGLLKPNYISHLPEYIRHTELPRGWKVLKFTKFTGDTNESTVEHIPRFQVESR